MGCVGDRILILSDEFLRVFIFFPALFFYVEWFAVHSAFFIIMNFLTRVCFCLCVLLRSVGTFQHRFFLTG